ncbi:MAG: RHS repeat-associated core domain-containing protein [Candidatus Nitrotoga sp.]
MTLGNNVRDITYDAGDRITAYTHYDASTLTATPSLDQSFGYDELGRLTSVITATANWSIGYDANGNRTSVTQNASTRAYTTETTSNRLASLTNPTRSLSYDNAGNTTNDSAGYTSTYDLAGRMATLTKEGITTTYSVDGMNRRVRKFNSTGAISTLIFVYGQQGQLLGEYSNTGTALREYVWLNNIPIAMFTPDPARSANPPLTYYFHTDHLGTPRVVIDKNNALRWRWLAEPFGTTTPENFGAFTQPLRFPGQYADAESGLNYNYFRDYDPSIGRYTTFDPIGLAGGINGYAYVGGNPVSYTDPKGLLCTFSQSTGAATCTDGISGDVYYHSNGYSGLAMGKNNPDMQDIPFFGPLPRGCYRVGAAISGGHTGPNSLPLTPLFTPDASNSFRDNNSFLIHGDALDPNRQGKASNGCPIFPPSRTDIKKGEIFCVTQ